LEQIRKQHFSATHHCSAWRLWPQVHEDLFGNILIDPKVSKANDDWEPTNTAWKPILNVLEWEKLLDIIAIVVRYFGGTLLWVWWLIQAYTQATKDAVTNCNIVEKEILKEFELIHGYNQTSLVAHLMEKYDAKLISEICDEKSKKVLVINQWLFSNFEKELFEASNGSLKVK
jgi:putative IMPACT (imprinted ancient) family translation regulator